MEANKPTEQQPNTLCSVVAEPSTTHALRGVVNKVQVAFTISTGHVEEQLQSKRPPLNLALVLDRSGSMDSDKKLVNAKAAIKKVIGAMGENDVLHLVLYGSKVKVAFENANVKDKEALMKTVDKVRTEGMTNMYGGLSTAAEVVRKHSKPGYTNRIFLFSDGLVNEGVTDKPQIYKFISGNIYTEGDTKVSAFGLGKDFDEELMRAVAEHGCGAYFFIEGSAAIPRFVSFALKGLFSLVGTDARLSVRGLGGNIITKIYSHGEDLTKPYRLDDLKQDDGRGVVCELQVTPTAEPSAEVLRWELLYRPATGESEANGAKGEDEAVKEHSISGTLRLHFTDDESEVAKAENGSVVAKVAIQRTGEIDAEITEHIKHRRTSEVIAAYEKELEILRSVVDKDVDGKANIAGHLKHTETALEDFRREGASQANLKKAHHRNYMKRRTSVCYDQQYLSEALQEEEEAPPVSDSDSDEEPVVSKPVRRRSLRFS